MSDYKVHVTFDVPVLSMDAYGRLSIQGCYIESIPIHNFFRIKDAVIYQVVNLDRGGKASWIKLLHNNFESALIRNNHND